MRPMKGWDYALQRASNPIRALEAMVAIHHMMPAEVTATIYPPELLYGVAFVTEAWMIRSEKDEGITEEEKQLLQERRLYQHPDRIEIRFIYCASADGATLTLCHERDGIAEAQTDPERMSGNIPDLLGALIKELKP
jgi:hypothetical protein